MENLCLHPLMITGVLKRFFRRGKEATSNERTDMKKNYLINYNSLVSQKKVNIISKCFSGTYMIYLASCTKLEWP